VPGVVGDRESRSQGEGAQRVSRGGLAGQEPPVNTGVAIVGKHGEGTAEPNANATVNDGARGEPGAWRRGRRVRGCGPGNRAGRKTGTTPRLDSTTAMVPTVASTCRPPNRRSAANRWTRQPQRGTSTAVTSSAASSTNTYAQHDNQSTSDTPRASEMVSGGVTLPRRG
jgi:hypothetical protein